MKKLALAAMAAALAWTPAQAAAQGAGIGIRAGTLGVGGEAALSLTDRIVLRGGAGFAPFDPKATFDDLDVTLKLPTQYNVGLDLYLTGAMRVGGGLLFRSAPEVTGEFTTPQDIGGSSYTPAELGTLKGVIDSGDRVPYILIGFGRHTAPGFGLFIDLGVAFLGDPDVRLDTEGGTLSSDVDPLRSSLDQEAANFEDDMRTYLRYWPILSLGFRVGLG